MALSGALLQAIHRYGPSVDHLARSHYGISGQALLAKLIKGESGGRGGAVSKAGARGYAQFMPGTRASVKAKYGVDPWRSPDEAVHAAALHLRGKVNAGQVGLSGYNPGGGQQYVDYILRQPVGNVSKGSRRAAQQGGTVGSTGASQTSSLSPGGTGLAGLLADLTSHPQAQTSLPTPPSFTRGPVMPKGYQQVESGGPQAQQPSMDDLLAAVGNLQGPDTTTTQANPGQGSPKRPRAHLPRAAGEGHLVISPGANRQGVGLTPGILKLARVLAGRVGHAITIGTGTNHNRLTVDGNVSDHWSGNAVDIPASGQSLRRLGYNALMAFGVPKTQARQMAARGGLFNIPYGQHRRIQVIFDTNQGGNHYNHLHLGVTALR